MSLERGEESRGVVDREESRAVLRGRLSLSQL